VKNLVLREALEAREQQILAPYAAKSADSKGRKVKEEPDWQRTCWQRDRDRVIHSRAWRRLKGKTQVFVAHHGDHFRTRLTHTLEVAQIARDLARSLMLNEDLAETIALAHDLGHTPFGHAGESALHQLLKPYGLSFEHNQQSRRIVEVLEKKSVDYVGLNLSWEVLDGLDKHNSKHEPLLEAQIVDYADSIAYLNHDLDDGLRAGLFTNKDLPVGAKNLSPLLGVMCKDLLLQTANNFAAEKYQVEWSPEMQKNITELRKFSVHNVYFHPQVKKQTELGKETIIKIFEALKKQPNKLPAKFRGDDLIAGIRDFIAGMTDDFALDFAAKL